MACAAVALSMIPLAAPIFLPDFLLGHDGGAHQTYAFQFNRALSQGQLPVRWVEGIGDGLGQPLFSHYQVGFYYLVSALHGTGLALSLAFKLTIAIQWAAGGLFLFLLCRPLGTLPAALGAAVFLWSPYILLNAYVRTAYPELTAIGFAPGVLWSIDRVMRTGKPLYACTLAALTGLLLISHLPTAVIVAPLAAAYAIGAWLVQRPGAPAAGLAAAGAITGASLAAFYVAPAILELDTIKIGRLTRDYFDYHRHFVQPAWWFDWSWGYGGSATGADDQMSVQIGIAQWCVLASGAIALLISPLRRRLPSPQAAAGCLAIVAAGLFMMTPLSAPVWELIGPLAYIQFPWRLLMVPAIACAVLAAALLAGVRHRLAQAIIVLAVVALQWYVTTDYRAAAWTRERAAIPIDDPAWPSSANAAAWAFREPAFDPASVRNTARRTRGRWVIVEGKGDVAPAALADARVELIVRAREPITVRLNTPFHPGWRVLLDGDRMLPAIDPESGYMSVRVPSGLHQIDAAFDDTRVRRSAEIVTIVSALLWFTLASGPWWRRRGADRPAHAPGHRGERRARPRDASGPAPRPV